MGNNSYHWVNKNRLICPDGYCLYCSGAFQYTLEDPRENRIIFPVIFNSKATPPFVELLIRPSTEWPNSGEPLSVDQFHKLLQLLSDGFSTRGFEAHIRLLDNQSLVDFYSPTLQIMAMMLETQGGKALDKYSIDPGLSDEERNIIWGEALLQFIRTNPGIKV